MSNASWSTRIALCAGAFLITMGAVGCVPDWPAPPAYPRAEEAKDQPVQLGRRFCSTVIKEGEGRQDARLGWVLGSGIVAAGGAVGGSVSTIYVAQQDDPGASEYALPITFFATAAVGVGILVLQEGLRQDSATARQAAIKGLGAKNDRDAYNACRRALAYD